MKKVKVENYKKPNYSTLKMVTGRMLPAGIVIASMIISVQNPNILANESTNTDYSLNGTSDFPLVAGVAPYPTIVTEKKPVAVFVNQVMIDYDAEPVWENGTVLVSFYKIFETLGAEITWDDKTKTATAVKGEDTIILAVDDTRMLKNGIEITLDIATKIVNNRLLVPIEVVSKGLGCDVSWNEIENQVIIECKEEPEIYITMGDMPVVEN